MYESQSSTVDRLYSDFKLIIEQIDDPENPASTISLRNSAEEIFQKSLYVAIGSYFERRIATIVLDIVGMSSSHSRLATEFVRKKANPGSITLILTGTKQTQTASLACSGQNSRLTWLNMCLKTLNMETL